MKKRYVLFGVGIVGILVFAVSIYVLLINNKDVYEIDATVLNNEDSFLTFQDKHNIIYTLNNNKVKDLKAGDDVLFRYTGLIDTKINVQDIKIVDYLKYSDDNKDEIPKLWLDDGMFKQYYLLAYEKLKELTIEEKIGQLIIGRYNETNSLSDLNNYKLGGFVFFENNFADKDIFEVQNMIKDLQNKADIPLITAVDEEGGKVVRISSNPKLVQEKFKSPKELYIDGGFSKIKEDIIIKNKILANLGINLNLAPVLDVSTKATSYMYDRTIGLGTSETANYAKSVMDANKGSGISYALKHFPGYGNALDTHNYVANIDESLSSIRNNFLPPFKVGIDNGSDIILVNHNIYNSIDLNNPASLSPTIHNILRDEFNFSGIVVTDNLNMKALINKDMVEVKALLAGNDMIITDDYIGSFQNIYNAYKKNIISSDTISKLAFRVIAWKYYKGLMFDNQK